VEIRAMLMKTVNNIPISKPSKPEPFATPIIKPIKPRLIPSTRG